MALDVYLRDDIQGILNSASHSISAPFVDKVLLMLQNNEINSKEATRLINAYNQGRNNAIFAIAAAFNIVRPTKN